MQSSYIDVTKCYLFYTSNKLIVVQYFGPILCSISHTKDLASRQGFDVRHLSDSCIILMHQRPGLKSPGKSRPDVLGTLHLDGKIKFKKKLKILSKLYSTIYQTNVLKNS